METKDRYYMGLALAGAEKAFEKGEVPVGAVLVDDAQKVLAHGHNLTVTTNDPTAHAEILVIRNAAEVIGNERLTGTTLYVTVEPCCMCSGALVWARISRLVYGAPDPKGGAAGSLYRIPEDERLNHRVEVFAGLMEEECRGIMQRFFLQQRGMKGR